MNTSMIQLSEVRLSNSCARLRRKYCKARGTEIVMRWYLHFSGAKHAQFVFLILV